MCSLSSTSDQRLSGIPSSGFQPKNILGGKKSSSGISCCHPILFLSLPLGTVAEASLWDHSHEKNWRSLASFTGVHPSKAYPKRLPQCDRRAAEEGQRLLKTRVASSPAQSRQKKVGYYSYRKKRMHVNITLLKLRRRGLAHMRIYPSPPTGFQFLPEICLELPVHTQVKIR